MQVDRNKLAEQIAKQLKASADKELLKAFESLGRKQAKETRDKAGVVQYWSEDKDDNPSTTLY